MVVEKQSILGFIERERCGDVSSVTVFGGNVYVRIGEISAVNIFGRNVYERNGNVRALFGFTWVWI